jgi:D-alanine-D-alanine ligase
MPAAERVLVLYNEPVLPAGHPDYESEREVLESVEAVSAALSGAGYAVSRLGLGHDPEALLAGLRRHQPDVVFNLFEGMGDHTVTETYVAGLLEWVGVPFTGCPFNTIVLARSKHLTKHLLRGEGLPTAPFFVPDELPIRSCPVAFPAIVKPAQQDCSIGVDQSSVVTDLEGLNRRVKHVLDQFGPPVLVEEFIFGRELTVALVEIPDLRLLPITEAVFPQDRPGYWPILSYDAKWSYTSSEYEVTDYHFTAELSPSLAARIDACARKAFRLLGARDYARMDFRVRNEEPFLLELNPNPDFAPDRALANNLWAAGISHADFTVQLVRNALARGRVAVAPRYRPQPLAG